ncbi:O-antigen ligase family protein [Candidatus Enterovibrio escicola]|uniref:O-antigen ligase family protein n=1 Tax=Candidatus Enterovibrio escicola TaxID=1927127 RepID=UPI001237EF6D|nr:O-antigen ligase family protein [Candidatus Enterovibrio escacola]
MKMRLFVFPQPFVNTSILLVPALLLSTPNFSVAVIACLFLYSLYYCVKYSGSLYITRFDWIVIFCLTSYTLANIPNVIIDGGNFRYLSGPSRFIACIPIYLMLRHLAPNPCSVIERLEVGIIIGSIGSFGIAFYQFIILNMVRVDGFIFSINFGYLSCSLLFLAFSLLSDSKHKNWLYISMILSLFSIISTNARGAIFSVPIILIASVVYLYHTIHLKIVALVSLSIILGFVCLYFLSGNFKERINFTKHEFSNIASGNIGKAVSSGGRLQLWKSATEAFKASPLIGSTYSKRECIIKKLHSKGDVTSWTEGVARGHAHSQYFEMLASNGLLGVIAISLILFAPSIYFFKKRKQVNNKIAYVGFLFVIGFIVYGLTEVPLQANLISSYYAFIVVTLVSLQENMVFRYRENNGKQKN